MLYVNLVDVDDEKMNVSKEEKELTIKFYEV